MCAPLERQAQKGPPERKTPRYGGGVREPKTAPKSVNQKGGGVLVQTRSLNLKPLPFLVHTFRGFRLYASVGRTSREPRLAPHGQFPDITGTLTGCSQTSWEDEEMGQNPYESPGPGGLGHHEAQGHARVYRTSRGPRLAPRGPFSDLTRTTTGPSPSSCSKLVVTLLGGALLHVRWRLRRGAALRCGRPRRIPRSRPRRSPGGRAASTGGTPACTQTARVACRRKLPTPCSRRPECGGRLPAGGACGSSIPDGSR